MDCKATVDSVCDALRLGLPDVNVLPEFPDGEQTTPLTVPTITVGVGKINVVSEPEVEYITVSSSVCTLKIRLTLCMPKTYTGQQCHDLINRTVLSLGRLTVTNNMTDIYFRGIVYSSALSALVAEGDFSVRETGIFIRP